MVRNAVASRNGVDGRVAAFLSLFGKERDALPRTVVQIEVEIQTLAICPAASLESTSVAVDMGAKPAR